MGSNRDHAMLTRHSFCAFYHYLRRSAVPGKTLMEPPGNGVVG
jgi:hypothetical protein